MFWFEGAGYDRLDFRDNISRRSKDNDQVGIRGVQLILDLHTSLQDGFLRVWKLTETNADTGRQRKAPGSKVGSYSIINLRRQVSTIFVDD